MSTTPPFARRNWLALLLLSPSLALANDAVSLGETTVTATRIEQPVDSVPSTVSVHTEQEIDRNNANNIKDLVRYEPGVSVSGTGSRFGLSGFNIRGIDGNRVLTQVDGVSVPQGFFFSPFQDVRRNYVDLDTVKRVEIIRGPASALYGSDAIGGAVSYLTKDAADYLEDGDDSYGRLKAGYDSSDNSWLRSGTVAGRSGQVDGLLHFGRRDGDELETFGGRGGTGSAREDANPQDYRSENMLVKGGWNYNGNDRVQLTYERYEDNADTNVLSEINSRATLASPAILSSIAKDSIDRDRISLENSFDASSLVSDHVRWQLSYQDSTSRQQTMQDRLTLTGVPRFRTRDGHYDEKLWNLTSQVDKSFTTGSLAHHLIWGFDAKRIESSNLRKGGEVRLDTGANVPGLETFPLSDFPDPTSDSYGLFVQDSVEIGKLTLLAGLRYDYYKLDPHVTDDYLRSNPPETDPSNYSDDYLSPKLGATYKLTDTESVYGQYAAGFRAPSPVYMFGELDNPGLGYRQIGNPNLKPETSNSYEVGLRGDHSIGNYSLALFYNQYDDFIEQVTTPLPGYFIGQFQWVNVDRATIRGAEAKGELHLQEFGMPSGTHLRGSIAYARGKDEDSGEPLNSVDPLKAVFGVGYAEPAGNYGADLYWTLVAAKDRIDDTQIANQFETPGYGTLDLTGWWRITDEVSVNAGVFNLADKQYWQWGDVQGLSGTSPAVGRFSQPGRNAAVNLVWEI